MKGLFSRLKIFGGLVGLLFVVALFIPDKPKADVATTQTTKWAFPAKKIVVPASSPPAEADRPTPAPSPSIALKLATLDGQTNTAPYDEALDHLAARCNDGRDKIAGFAADTQATFVRNGIHTNTILGLLRTVDGSTKGLNDGGSCKPEFDAMVATLN